MTPRVVLMAVSALALILLGYGFVSHRVLEKSKGDLLSKRRAVETTLGPDWFALSGKLEKLVLDTGRDWPGDWVDAEAGRTDFRSLPGIYLRLRRAEAKDAAALRGAAKSSVKDAFAACLLRPTTPPKLPDGGVGQEQPWNLRQAYASTRVLTDEWANEVKLSSDDLRLRVFEQQFDKATREEIPLAVDIVKRAAFFLLVLDEDAPEALEKVDGGAITMEALQLVSHDARVRVWNLKTGAEIARVRRRGEGGFRFVGEQTVQDPETLDAMQRQVNGCALANRVKEALGVK